MTDRECAMIAEILGEIRDLVDELYQVFAVSDSDLNIKVGGTDPD